MAESVARKSNAPQRAAKEPRRHANEAPYLSIRYWKKMRMNKVYPILVSFAGKGEAEPVTVRVVMAGAQVVPAEQVMDPANPGEKATFYVTPIAQGGLRGERVEVLQNGRKIQEVRIPCKVNSQRSTLVWLFLAFFIPWLFLHYFQYAPIGYTPPTEFDGTPANVRKPWEKYAIDADANGHAYDKRADRIKHFFEDNMPKVDIDPDINKMYKEAQDYPRIGYLDLFDFYNRSLGQPVPFYLFCFLLLVTLISALSRREARKTAYSKPLVAD